MANRNALKAGDLLGRFQLLVAIGAGGMGRVWVAREQGVGPRPRIVAIKTALAEDAASEDFWKVLLDEARIASQVSHPNVCSIHALDRERGVVYLVMDFSDGGSLRELLDELPENRMEHTVAARLVARVCSGLHAAHELMGEDGTALGVVHRDVSPQNILISANGQVKITDFGVAKARGQLHAPTQTGEVKGKLSYMAPEQVTTRDVDRRADVFALGCVLYEATVGARPFHGGDALATLYQLLEQPLVAPSARRPDFPPGLERIVIKALERDPSARYQTTEDMGRALEMWLASERAMVSEPDIAALVEQALGARVRARNEAIQAAVTAINAPEPEEIPEPAAPAVIETLSGSASNTLPGDSHGARVGRRLRWAAMAGLAVVLTLGVTLAGRRTDSEEPKPASAVPAPKPEGVEGTRTPTPEPTPNVVVTLRADPANAELFLDDGPALPNPYNVSVAPDDRPHRVRASLQGYVEEAREVRFDRTKELVIVLREAARKPIVRVGQPVPAGSTGTSAPVLVRKPGELPPVTKKQPRTLDSENPFGEQP